jgi:WD40 repeat protein
MFPTSYSARCCVGLLLVLTYRVPAWGAPAPTGKIVGTDAYGDLLPVGALSRLGTERLVHAGANKLLAFSPDGTMLASAAQGGSVCLWRTDSGKELRRFQTTGMHDSPSALAFSPDNMRIVLGCRKGGGDDSALFVWDVISGKKVPGFGALPAIPGCLAFFQDGKILAVSCHPRLTDRGTTLFFDPANGKEIARFENPGGMIAFADEGKTLLLFERKPEEKTDIIHVWDVAERKERTQHTLKPEGYPP